MIRALQHGVNPGEVWRQVYGYTIEKDAAMQDLTPASLFHDPRMKVPPKRFAVLHRQAHGLVEVF